MNEEFFLWLTPLTYWLLVILWGTILVLYVRVIHDWTHTSLAMKVLLWVLFIDAIRTLFESIYFGGWYTARVGMLPEFVYEFLVQPQHVFFPKLVNVLAALVILTLLLRRWFPHLASELETQSTQIGQLARAQELAHVGNWEWDIVSNELAWSDEIYRIFGLEPRQFGATYEAFLQSVHPDDRSRVTEAVERAVAEPDYRYSIEHRVVHPDGTLRTVHEVGRVLRNQEGQPIRMSGTVRDVTEERLASEELKEAKDAAEAADRVKSAFLATMSHELRTPLNSIIGFTGMLLKGLAGPLNQEQEKQLEMVRGSSRHLLDLVCDVLDISKIEAGQLEVCCERFDVGTSVRKAVGLLATRAATKGIELSLEIAPDVIEVDSDCRRIEQVLLNLLSNAVKFTESGGVHVDCRRCDESLEICVQDTGIGIAPEDMDRLFQPFQQLDTGLSRQHEGTGLGLSISRKLIELLGGHIWVESEPGQGSRFSFEIPLKVENVDHEAQDPGYRRQRAEPVPGAVHSREPRV